MNIQPGPRKQPSVSPPGQLQGQPQLRPQHTYSGRGGHTPPVNIRQQTPENFDNSLHYPRFSTTRFSQSPSNYTNLGSSPHQPQPVAHNPQQPQAQQHIHVRNVASGHVSTPLVLDSSSIHSYYPASSGGPQVSNSQQSSSHPQAVQLQTAAPVVYSGQPQNFPTPQGHAHFQSTHPGGQSHQQQQQQQQSQQQPSQQQGYHNQQARFQPPAQSYHPRQASQAAEIQVNHSHPSSQPQQPTQVLLSQPFTQGSVPHDLGKSPLGSAVPPRGQTPPQSALTTGIMQPYAQNAQQAQRPTAQTFTPRVSMSQNMGQRPPRPMTNNPMYPQFQQIMVPNNQLTGQMAAPLILSPPNTNQVQIQYPSGPRLQSYQVPSQQQQQVYPTGYYHNNNQIYVAPQSQNQWPQTQVRLPINQVPSTQQQTPVYSRREKKPIDIVDPSTGKNVKLDDISKTNDTPPQAGTPDSRDTPVSQPAAVPPPPNPNQNASIAAQFATQVAATLNKENSGAQIQAMALQQQQAQMTSSMQQQVPPGAPPHPQMVSMQMNQRPNLNPQNQQPGMAQQTMNPRKPQPMPSQGKPKPTGGIPQPQQPHQQMMPQHQPGPNQPGMMVPGGPGMHPPHGPGPVQQQGPPPAQVQPAPVPQQPAPQPVQQQQITPTVSTQQANQPPSPVQEPKIQAKAEQNVEAKPEPEEPTATSVPIDAVVDDTATAAAVCAPEATPSQPPEKAQKEPSPVEEPLVKDTTAENVPEVTGNTNESVSQPIKSEPAPLAPVTATPPDQSAPPKSGPAVTEPTPTAPENSQAAQQPAQETTPQPAKPESVPSAPVSRASPPVQVTLQQPVSVQLPQREEAKDRRKKAVSGKGKTKDLNQKPEGSDMDAFTDAKEGTSESTEVSESSKAEATSAPPQRSTTDSPLPDQPKQETPTAQDKPSVATPQEASESSASQEEQRRVAERNEKNSKEHSKVEEPGKESSENKENHLDDSDIEKNETPVIKKDKMELKYKYREDQWSPLNPEGKKHYDRGFLLQLQFSSESMEKPFNLPQLPDVVLETPISTRNEKQFGPTNTAHSAGLMDFTPSYVMQNFGGKPPVHVHKSNSRQKTSRGGPPGGGGGGGEHRKVISLQLQHDVKLHHTDKAWKPGSQKKEDLTENEDIFGKIRSILNKLTPQKFQKLLAQVIELGIDTEDKLAGTIDITFEKAISEPNFSVAYANLCKCLNNLKVPQKNNPEQPIMFRKLLLNRCQKEFEKDKAEALDLAEMQKAIDEAPKEKKKELMDAKYIIETRARKRSLGNIRFIGELFKLRMLTEGIMHDCLVKLLRAEDEDSLEALCNLLKTIGKDLDMDRSKSKVDSYFNQLNKLVDQKKNSSRLRFMLLDAIDLRKNNWVPRREDNNPKTIEQIHKEALQEVEQKKIMLQNMPHDHKGKSRGGRGSQSGSHSNQQGEDGWTNVKPTRTPSIDPAKMKLTKQVPMDESNISLGRPGGFGSWGRGSSGGSKQASKESERPTPPGNRYSLLSSAGGPDNQDSGRHGVGRGSSVMSGGRDSKGGRLSQGRDRGKLTSRPSLEQERESAIAAVRTLRSGRSTSGSRVSGGSRNSSRDNSRTRSRDNSRNRERSSDRRPSKKGNEMSVEEIEKKSKALMSEYMQINDMKEALQCVRELESPQNLHVCVNAILTHVLERSEKARKMASQLLHEAIKQKVLTPEHYSKGLIDVLEFADDMAIDIPQIWKYLGELIGPMIEDGTWHISNLRTACKTLVSLNKAGILMSEILHDASHRLGHIKVGEIWRAANMSWSDFLPQGDDMQSFIAKYKLEFTTGQEAPKSPEATTVPIDTVQKGLENLVIEKQSDNEVVFDWINANVADHRTREASFIRALMSAVCSSAIVGQAQSCKVEPQQIKKRCILLQRYLDHDAKLELQALYALQALVHKLEHPPEVLRVFFDTLYDEDIISEDAFYHWESSTDAAEQAGKGVAVSSVVQFFTWLREAEEDDPEAANK